MKRDPKHIFPILLLLLLISSCAAIKPITPPASTEVALPKLVQPISEVEIPVTVDLRNYIVQAENSVPVKYTDNKQVCEGLSYSYVFTRTPFAITGSNNVVNLKFTGSYGFSVSYCAKCTSIFGNGPQCLVPTVSAQCGWGDEPTRRMEISYQSVINVTPDYHLVSKTVLFPAPKPIDRCNVFMKNIDITDRLINYISGPLNDLGKQVDAKIAAYDIKPMINELWNYFAGEIKMADVGYLSINPELVRLSNFSLNGSLLNFSVGMTGRPVVTTVSAPPPPKPVPNLSTYTPKNGFNIYLDLLENYDHLTNIVNQQVAGQGASVVGNDFVVDHTKIWGIGTQIVMQVDFKGSSTGTVYLVGTPTYNQVTHELSFPDLAFTLETKAWILKTAKWMFNEKITNMLRQKATYNFTQFIADSKKQIEKEMRRDYGNNISSEVAIKDMDIQSIYPTSEKLIIRTFSTGQIKVKVVM